MKRPIFILIVLSFFLQMPLASAQFESVNSQADINVAMIPENPSPNKPVTISLTSYITSMDSATISWSVDGKASKSGRGEKSLTVTAKDNGVATRVDISIRTAEGETFTKTVSIRPTEVDLMWQSESYTPPFYKGKALFSYQNRITFIAIPHIRGSNGAEISPKSLIYKWIRNGSVEESASGYGKNTYLFIPTIIARPVDIRVEVSVPNSTVTGAAMTSIAPTDPVVRLYEKNPLYGIEFQKALLGTQLMRDAREISVVAIPYFFGTQNPLERLTYAWTINGARIDSDLSQTTRVFRHAEGTSGVASIGVSIGSTNKVLQTGKATFDLKFEDVQAEQPAF